MGARIDQFCEDLRQKLITAAQADIKAWGDEKKAATSEKIAEWKAKREARY